MPTTFAADISMKKSWRNLNASLWALSVESAAVIGLRAFRIGLGTAGSHAEQVRMVREKVQAAADLQAKAWRGELGASPLAIASNSINHYRRRVRANRRRLGS